MRHAPTLLLDEDAPWRWPYLIFDFVPGNSIGEVYDRVSFEDKLELSRQLGQITSKMHRLSIAKIPIYAKKGWESYANFLVTQQQICVRNHQKWGSLSDRLIAQIKDYLLPVKEIIDFENPPSLIHADITRDHILGQIKDSRWETKALIDYGDAMIGDIFYELAAIHLDTFQCDRRLLKSFLESYGLSAHQKQDFVRKAMSVVLLHQFDVFYGIHTHQSESIDRLETLANQLWKIDA